MKQLLLFLLLNTAFTAPKAQLPIDTAAIHFVLPPTCSSISEAEAGKAGQMVIRYKGSGAVVSHKYYFSRAYRSPGITL